MKANLTISLHDLCKIERIESDIIFEIVDYGIVQPIEDSDSDEWHFETTSVYWIKKALRLAQELELDWLAVALLIDLMQQRETLQKENTLFKQQLRRFVQK